MEPIKFGPSWSWLPQICNSLQQVQNNIRQSLETSSAMVNNYQNHGVQIVTNSLLFLDLPSMNSELLYKLNILYVLHFGMTNQQVCYNNQTKKYIWSCIDSLYTSSWI